MRRSQMRKKTYNFTVFLVLSGSARKKAVHRTLMKLSPDEGVIFDIRAVISNQDAEAHKGAVRVYQGCR